MRYQKSDQNKNCRACREDSEYTLNYLPITIIMEIGIFQNFELSPF